MYTNELIVLPLADCSLPVPLMCPMGLCGTAMPTQRRAVRTKQERSCIFDPGLQLFCSSCICDSQQICRRMFSEQVDLLL